MGSSKRGSWLISVRQSYLQWLLARLGYDGTTFGFTDAQSKIVFDLTPRHQFQFTTIAGRSRFDQADTDPGPRYVKVGTGSGAIGIAGWRSTFGSSVVLTQRLAAISDRFHNEGSVTPDLARSVATELSYHADAAWTPRSSLMFQAGTYLQRQRETMAMTSFLETPAGTSQAQRAESADGSAWVSSGDARVVWTAPQRFAQSLSVDAGMRLAHSTLTGDVMPMPWLLGAWSPDRLWTLRGGASLTEQVPDFPQVIGTFGDADARPERAGHVDIALEHRPDRGVSWQVSVFQRRERDMLRFERSETRFVDGRLVFASSLTPAWQNALSGSARGVELLIQRRDSARVSGWIGYTYGRVRYEDALTGESYWGDYDQRHTVSAYGKIRLSAQTSLGAKMRFGSNFPMAGYFEQRPSGWFAGTTRNTLRLPDYARLDVRAERAFNYSRRRLTLFGEVINVLNRANVAPANGVVSASGRALEFTDAMFPLLPSAGLRIDF